MHIELPTIQIEYMQQTETGLLEIGLQRPSAMRTNDDGTIPYEKSTFYIDTSKCSVYVGLDEKFIIEL